MRISRKPYTLAVLLPFLVLDGRSNSIKDESQVSPSNSISATQAQLINYTYVISLSENESFVGGVRDAVRSIPLGVRDFIFSPKYNSGGYKVFVRDKLLTECFPENEQTLRYSSGCTTASERRIDLSSKVRRQVKVEEEIDGRKQEKIVDQVFDYKFPRNITYHELGHAFDNMLFECLLSSTVKETTERYYSYHSRKFIDAYEADLRELKEKIKAGKIPKDEADRILRSYYVVEKTESTSGKEEVFAETFCMVMLGFEKDDSWKDDSKRIPDFLSYFPRCKQVVLDQIEFVSPGFKNTYKEITMPSSD